jgi:Transcription factor subunit Med10 of Mediator complex
MVNVKTNKITISKGGVLNKNNTNTSGAIDAPLSHGNTGISQSTKILQDRIHELITRLSATIEHVRNWPDDSNETVIKTERAKLISFIRDVVSSIQRIEQCIKNDTKLKLSLQNCRIPYDLLDLLEYELNPECFTRGLLREAMGQLAGLKRRKHALEMLGSAVQNGLDERDKLELARLKQTKIDGMRKKKDDAQSSDAISKVKTSDSISGPPTKKAKLE